MASKFISNRGLVRFSDPFLRLRLNDLTEKRWFVGLAIGAMLFVTRANTFGDPVLHVDDQFYRVVGHFFGAGELPYVDIWDRKPIGLFVIYALISRLGGDGTIAYQAAAAAAVAASSALIFCIATRISSRTGALLAALLYLALIVPFGGEGGQSPVFYNPMMALAALLTIKSIETPSRLVFFAAVAMLMCGLAMTVKQVAFVEGVFFGICFLALAYNAGKDLMWIASFALALVAVALLPTLLAMSTFAARGHLSEFFFANFVSIFLKETSGVRWWGLLYWSLYLAAPVIIAAISSFIRWRGDFNRGVVIFVDCWIISSFVGAVAIPNFFDHYALPLIQPLSLGCATFFSRPLGAVLLVALSFNASAEKPFTNRHLHVTEAAQYEKINRAVRSHLNGGCLFIAGGPPLLYATTGACHSTRYLFSEHLMRGLESKAVGVDTRLELARVLDSGPDVIVHRKIPWDDYDLNQVMLVESFLSRKYRLVGIFSGKLEQRYQVIQVWQRSDISVKKR